MLLLVTQEPIPELNLTRYVFACHIAYTVVDSVKYEPVAVTHPSVESFVADELVFHPINV